MLLTKQERINKVATIVPLAHLEETRGDAYLLALSHVARESVEYVEFFREQAKHGAFVILDNSAVELGAPHDGEEYFALAMRMGVSELVLPDYFRDAEKTLKAAERAGVQARALGFQGKMMFIPQGKTLEEWIWCVEKAVVLPFVSAIGISYRYVPDLFPSRLVALLYIIRLLQWAGIRAHMLGCGLDPFDEASHALDLSRVRSIDSALPSIFAKHERPIQFDIPRPPRDLNFLTDKYDDSLIKINIRLWKERCGGS